jgi:hypothetical protein
MLAVAVPPPAAIVAPPVVFTVMVRVWFVPTKFVSFGGLI